DAPAASGPVPMPSVAFARRALTPGLGEWIDRLNPDLRRMGGYQLGLRDATGAPTGTVAGKFVRPAFVLLSASAVGGRPLDALAPALAAELLHNASLVHDDIMDGDTERRHRPTVWAQFGPAQAILVGDALIGLGFEVLSSDPHPCAPAATTDLARTFRRVVIGQSRDLRYERFDQVTTRDCLEMLEGKTGEMLGLACRLGARYGGAPERWADRLGRFGVHLGVAFQLIDDILGIWGDPAETGKPVGADLRRRKKSAPVIAAMATGTAGAAHLRRRYADATDLGDAEVALLTEAVEEAGGRTWTWHEAERRIDAAWQELTELDLHGPAVGELRCLTDELLHRRC
ncbi:MAG TPA: polyprenyl synthetase family protein, partial [Micromonospora sp.]